MQFVMDFNRICTVHCCYLGLGLLVKKDLSRWSMLSRIWLFFNLFVLINLSKRALARGLKWCYRRSQYRLL